MIPLLVQASCATPPPSGQECNDTIEMLAPPSVWLSFVILGVIVVVVTIVMTRRRRDR